MNFRTGAWITIVVVLLSICVFWITKVVHDAADDMGSGVHLSTTIYGADTTIPVKDTGMENTVVVASFHFFDTYEDLNFEYNTLWLEDGEEEQELWGWSNCEWQPEANVAFCDIYTIRPEFVHSDMAMDTIGHEIWHGVTGDFHD